MRLTVCIFLICTVSYLAQRYSCLNFIDVRMANDGKPHRIVRKNSAYLHNSDIIQENYKDSRRIQTLSTSSQTRDIRKKPQKAVKVTVNTYLNAHSYIKITNMPYPPIRSSTPKFDIRRYFAINNDGNLRAPKIRTGEYEDEKDANLKVKISTLVQQTIHDTERKIKSVQHIKEKNREEAPYKAGFILSMIKKSRDVLNELFNVAVKHKDEWKALEQLKIFELIVHTNVDTTNLVRQLVEIHIQHLNATSPHNGKEVKRRMVLIR